MIEEIERLERKRAATEAEILASMDPDVRRWLDEIRGLFGAGVRFGPSVPIGKGRPWPGGNWVTRGP